MKKYVLALAACLLAFPAAAAEALPQGIHDALTLLPGLQEQQSRLQAVGQTLSEQDQQRLERYQSALKGVIIVKVGFAGCPPCQALERALSQSPDGIALVNLWKEKGFGFYEISSIEESRRAKPNFLSVWGANTNPMMFFFKDGQLQTVLRGFNSKQPDETLQKMRDWTNSVR